MPKPRQSTEVDKHIGLKLRVARKQRKISQTALGESLGISFQQVQKYERGANRLSVSRLWDAANLLNVPISWFFNELNSPASEEATRAPTAFEALMRSPDGNKFAEALENIPQGSDRRNLLRLMKAMADASKG